MRRLKSALTVIGAVTVLVLAGNTVALATTGHALILGRTNKANQATVLKRTTAGSALQVVTTSSSAAPFTVNGRGKVANLNADQLDGLDSSSLRTLTYSWIKQVVASDVVTVGVPVPPGTYVVGYDAPMHGAGTDGGSAACWFWLNHDSVNTIYGETSALTKAGVDPALSGSAVVTVASGDQLGFYCQAPVAFTSDLLEPLRIYATRTSVVSGASLRIAAPGARAVP
jgi:hypothetical protein